MVWAISSSLAATTEIVIYFLFLQVLRCVSSLRYPLNAYVFSEEYYSEIPGSKPASGSPRLIAATLRPSSAPDAKTSTIHP